jgi:SAM-dependent methyltransferase
MMAACPICRNTKKVALEDSRLSLYECTSCAHFFSVISKESQEQYDEEYYLQRGKNWFKYPNYRLFDFIYQKLITLLDPNQIRLLDVGCGKGDFLKYILERIPTASLVGVDFTENNHPNIHFIRGDFLEAEFQFNFNVICCLAVIEHLEDPVLVLQKINDLLEPGGLLCLMSLNNNSLFYRIARLFKKIGITVAYDRLYSPHHLQHYTNQSLKKAVETTGFEVLVHRNHGYPLKAIDVPAGNVTIRCLYKIFASLVFILAEPLQAGFLQTVIGKKNKTVRSEYSIQAIT